MTLWWSSLSDDACLKEVWFRNSNCKLPIYATYDFLFMYTLMSSVNT